MLPAAVFAVEAETEPTEVLTLPVVSEEAPTLMSLTPHNDACIYAYEGSSLASLYRNGGSITFPVEEGVTPTAGGVVQVLDASGAVLAGSSTVRYYKSYDDPTRWYISSGISFNDQNADAEHQFANIPAGEYRLQLAVGEERYVLDQTLRVVSKDALLISDIYLQLYSDSQTAEVEMELYGMESEDDLAGLSLTLTDEEGGTVARSTGAFRDFAYNSAYGHWRFYMELKLEEGQQLQNGTEYSLTIADTGSRELVDGSGVVISGAWDHSTTLGDIWFSDAQNGVLAVELLYPGEGESYDVLVSEDYEQNVVFASWSGTVPANSVITVPLRQSGAATPADSYPYNFYVSWKNSNSTYWQRDSVENPYVGNRGVNAWFYPSEISTSVGTQTFAIEVMDFGAYKGDGTDVLTMFSRYDEEVARCTSLTEDWEDGRIVLTGSMTIPQDLPVGSYNLFLNGEQFDSVRTVSVLYAQTSVEYLTYEGGDNGYVFWTNFGVVPISADVLNGNGSGRFELRDESGNVCLTTGPLTMTAGEYSGYEHYEGEFLQEDLAAYAGQPLNLYFTDGSNSIKVYSDPVVYDDTVYEIIFPGGNTENNTYFYWYEMEPGSTSVRFYWYGNFRNISEDMLRDRMADLRLVCGETTLTMTDLVLGQGNDSHAYMVFSAPITAGEWEIYDGDSLIETRTLRNPTPEELAPYVSNMVQPDGWYLYCRNLSEDSVYTAKLYKDFTCLTGEEITLSLKGNEDEQRLYLPRSLVAGLARGTYELRISRDGLLMGSASLEAEGALQPTVIMRDIYYGGRDMSRIVRGTHLLFEVSGNHNWTHIRFADSESELENAYWYLYDTLYTLKDTETIGERVVYVQFMQRDADMEEPLAISDPVVLSYLYLGEEGQINVTVDESVEGFCSEETVLLSMGADYPYAFGMVELIDGDGRKTCLPLTYLGQGPLRPLSSSSAANELFGSSHPYDSYMDETWTYTVEGAESINVTFSEDTQTEANYDYIHVHYVQDGNDTYYGTYDGIQLAGKTLTLPGDTVKIRLTSDGSNEKYGFSVISVVDPAAPPVEEDGEPVPTYHLYGVNVNAYDYLGTEKVALYLVEDSNDDDGYRNSLVSNVVERDLVFGDPTAVILPQFDQEYEEEVLISRDSFSLYGYGIPGSTVTLSYFIKDGEDGVLGTATAAANGKFTMELTDLADGIYNLTATSETDDNVIYGSGTLVVDTTAPEITAIGFAFTDSDTATLRWTCTDADLDESIVYLVTASGDRRLGYVNPSYNMDGVQSMTVTARNNGQQFKVVVKDRAGNTSYKVISTSDQEPPTAPGELEYISRTTTTVTLQWTEGTDNIGVAGYAIYKDGVKLAETGKQDLTYYVEDLEQGTEYTFTVKTVDLAGNISEEPNPEVTVTTAKLQLDASVPGTISANGSDTVEVKVSSVLTSDVNDYAPGTTDLKLRYQVKGSAAAPAEDQWIEQSLSEVILNGRTASGVWNIDVPDQLPVTYYVQLVAEDDYEATAYSDIATLTLVDGRVTFHLVDSKTLEPITDGNISIYQDGKLVLGGDANAAGDVMLGLENGSYSLVAQATGYQMRSITSVTISEDRLEFTVYMNTEGIMKAEISAEEMTYEEIVAAGIDPAAVGNKHVYQCTVILDFVPVPIEYVCIDNEVVKSDPVVTDDFVIYPAAKDIFLIVPTQTTWLKEMFDVQLLVTNSSAVEDIENCEATLHLPNGLSLADMFTGTQSTTVQLGAITPGSCATHHWYVRGDSEGSYTLQGNVTGTRVGGGLSEDIEVGFATKSPIHVLAGSAMELTIEAEKYATVGEPYNMRFTLRNVSNKSLYNVNFEVLGGTFRQEYSISDVLASYDLEGPFQPGANNSDLANGFTLSAAEFKPGDVLSGKFTITFAQGLSPEFTEYMLKQVFLFTGAGSTTEIPTKVIWVDSVSDHVHDYDDGVVTKAPTCEEDGEITYTCECGDTVVAPVPATGHNMTDWTVEKAATCTEPGSAYRRCTNCTLKEFMVLSALGHNWSEEWTTDVEPTCTEEGSKSHHCTRCDEKTDVTVIPEKGHTYGDWEQHNETQHKHTCTVSGCGYVEYQDHQWDDGVQTKAPTHLEEGVTTFTCTVCNKTRTEPISKLPDHIWGDWTKISDTQHQRTCPCEASEVADHVWSDWTTTKEPTCTVDGEERRDCTDCDAFETKVKPAPGHSWDDGVVTKEPTLTENGERTYTCTVCGETKTESMSKLKLQEMYFSVNLLGKDMVKTYGDPKFIDMVFNEDVEEPELTFSSSDESVATVDEDGYVTIKGVGTTVISATSAAVPRQFAETTASYKLIVNKAELTVTANDASIVYGEAFAPNGFTAEGFVYNETAAVLSGEANYTCAYEQYGVAGEYEITVDGLTSKNYNITFVPGKLTVGKAAAYTIVFGNLSQKSDAVTPVTATVVPQDDTAVISLEYKVGDTWTTVMPTEVGTYPVRAKLLSSDNLAVDGKTYGDQLVIEAVDSIGGISVSVKTDEDKATVEVTDEEVEQIVEKLEDSNGDLAVNLESVEQDTLVLPGNLIEELDKSDDLETVTVTTGASSITMSDDVVETMADAMDKDDTVSLQMNTKDMDDLTEEQQEALESIGGPSPQTVVLELKLTVTDAEGNVKQEISELGDKVEITLQCTEEMQGKRMVACYISPDGTVTYLVAKYDAEANTLTFTTDHFSIYAAVELSENQYVVFVVDEDGRELPAEGTGPQTVGAEVSVQAPAAPAGYRFVGWEVVEGDITLEKASSTGTAAFTMPDADVTLKVKYARNDSGITAVAHAITVAETENGTVTLSSKSAVQGNKVTVTVKPDQGYVLEKLTVLDAAGREVKVTKLAQNKYTFLMSAGKVTVKAVFAEAENPFVDVPGNAYYYDAVQWAVEEGITSGISADRFGPAQACTRAQMVTFLWRAEGCPEAAAAELPFTDVSKNAYYYKAVLWAVEAGITNGTSATTFSPDATVTRAQTVTFLWRLAGKPEATAANPFTDVAANAYYYEAVLWAVEAGITNGTGAATFGSEGNCLRSQIVTFLYRYAKQ